MEGNSETEDTTEEEEKSKLAKGEMRLELCGCIATRSVRSMWVLTSLLSP